MSEEAKQEAERPPSQELDEWEPELMMEVGNDWQEGVDEVTD